MKSKKHSHKIGEIFEKLMTVLGPYWWSGSKNGKRCSAHR